ncbi:hypothetical protein TNCT_82881 [Trichonephila clavata]|uniref:RING-type domain-containing protein n=1 Tax=Trichonephila clavata TaxID=2740835 RepID=A0A8X6GC86_TRICU|nr:hypothetical protein TNCT_82881 [Trichonephila clavata]
MAEGRGYRLIMEEEIFDLVAFRVLLARKFVPTPGDEQRYVKVPIICLNVVNGDPNMFCSICQIQDTDRTWLRLFCGHSGHYSCLTKWLQVNPTCPICRR